MSEFVTSTFIVCMIFMCVGFVTIEQKIMNIHKTNPIDEISYGRMLKVKRKLEIALSILVCSMLFYIIFALAGWFGVMLITIWAKAQFLIMQFHGGREFMRGLVFGMRYMRRC